MNNKKNDSIHILQLLMLILIGVSIKVYLSLHVRSMKQFNLCCNHITNSRLVSRQFTSGRSDTNNNNWESSSERNTGFSC